MQTYEHYLNTAKKGRSKTSKRLELNTYAIINDDLSVSIRYHQTDIVIYKPDGSITLNSGGWRSKTTKQRLNMYSPCNIYQRNFVWYLADGSMFFDGVMVDGSGHPINPISQKNTDAIKSKTAKNQIKAKKYADDFVKALERGQIAIPSGADCWYCSMSDTKTGLDLGTASQNYEHIAEHIRERYFVPSLLLNAIKAKGYQPHQYAYFGFGGQKVYINPKPALYQFVLSALQKADAQKVAK